MLVAPHIICVVIATIFNIVGWYMNKRGFVLTGAILYAVSILMFPLYFLFCCGANRTFLCWICENAEKLIYNGDIQKGLQQMP